MKIVKLKDKRIGWATTIIVHIILIIFIFFNKGCVEIQNPPQFTLEEIITLDFSSDKGGGSEGSSSKETQKESSSSTKEEAVQDESPVLAQPGLIEEETDSEAAAETQESKYDLGDAFGHGNNDSGNESGDGNGEGNGNGDGVNTGGGIGDGKGRQVIGTPELDNRYKWEGYVMVEFIIDRVGNTLSTRVLHPHPKTTITLTNSFKKFIEEDCKKKFKFTPSSSAKKKDRVFKRMQYALE